MCVIFLRLLVAAALVTLATCSVNIHRAFHRLNNIMGTTHENDVENTGLFEETIMFNNNEEKLVTISQGSVMGLYRENYRAFYGIPYAKAPVGNLRWRLPQKLERFPEKLHLFKATAYGKTCVQFSSDKLSLLSNQVIGSNSYEDEDCLNLNVTTPRLAAIQKAGGRVPVMIFIHGGSFNSGGNSFPLYQPRNFVAKYKNVIVVNVNYRLGLNGYFASKELKQEATEDGHASFGNYGLHDQVMALEWVRDNIAAFGGDPQNVTLFGHSAGSISVNYLYMLMSIGRIPRLFHKIIMQSGVIASWTPRDLATQPTIQQVFDLIAKDVGCFYETEKAQLKAKVRVLPQTPLLPADRLACLRTRSWRDIQKAAVARRFDEQWGPACDDVFVPQNPASALFEAAPSDVPVMIGRVIDEGSVFFMDHRFDKANGYCDLIKQHFGAIADEIHEIYDFSRYGKDPHRASGKIAGDAVLKCPIQHTALQLAKRSPRVFLYRWDVELSLAAKVMSILKQPPLGVFHGIELMFLFEFSLKMLSKEEQASSKAMQMRWLAFAYTGSPNYKGVPRWNAVSPAKQLSSKCRFWERHAFPNSKLKVPVFDVAPKVARSNKVSDGERPIDGCSLVSYAGSDNEASPEESKENGDESRSPSRRCDTPRRAEQPQLNFSIFLPDARRGERLRRQNTANIAPFGGVGGGVTADDAASVDERIAINDIVQRVLSESAIEHAKDAPKKP